ncbi:MAG TPA: hypothetical protein VGQ62_05610 [Chloroflexota bacterium]|jgi:hypothetical protein|nr:hypothetical protein [Chloroflexota bacterium]
MSRPLTVAWTGHRPDVFADPTSAQATVESTARLLVANDNASHFLVGGQRGVDTWAALAARALGIPFTVILPLPAHVFADERWTAADRTVLEDLLASAETVTIVGGARDQAFAERNRRLATADDLLVAVWTGTPGGGTQETIVLARTVGTPVREIVVRPSSDAHAKQGRGI